MKETLLPLALSYLQKGYSILPTGLDKRPLVSWKEFQTRKASIEEVIGWFEKFPEAQLGIVTGAISDLTVVDIEGEGDFDLIKDETYTVKTGGLGRHMYFTYDKDFQNAVRVLPFVDIRSEGGFVVAPGSISSKGSYGVIKDIPIVKMSDATKSLLVDARKSNFEPSTSSSVPLSDYPGYGPGQRNDQMAKYVGSVLARTHPALWDTTGWLTVLGANQRNTPPLPEYELRSTWNSLKSREVSQNPLGRTMTPFGTREPFWGPTVASQAPVDGEIKRAVIMHASEVAAAQVIDTDHTYPVGMKPFDEALLGGFSPGDLIAVAGKSGVGKTSLVLDWSVTLASTQESKLEGLPTLWFSYEVLARPLWEKFTKVGADERTPIYLPSYNESGSSEWVTEMIKQGIKEKGIKVVAIDHLGFLQPPKGNYSNNADAITHTVRMLKRLSVEHGLITMIPVHVRKTNKREMDQDDVSDSKGIVNESDALFFIDRMRGSNGLATEQAKIWLSKNRKTGVNTSGIFDFKFGRYFYNEQATKAEGLMEEQSQKAEEKWNEPDEPIVVVAPVVKEKVETKKEVEYVAPPSLWEKIDEKIEAGEVGDSVFHGRGIEILKEVYEDGEGEEMYDDTGY